MFDVDQAPMKTHSLDQVKQEGWAQPISKSIHPQIHPHILLRRLAFCVAGLLLYLYVSLPWSKLALRLKPDWETYVLQEANADTIRSFSRDYTSYAHLAASKGDWRSVKYTQNQFRRLLHITPFATTDDQDVYEAGSPEANAAFHSNNDATEPYVHVSTYYTYMTKPLGNSSVTLSNDEGQVTFTARLEEVAVEKDATSQHGNNDVPIFHGMFASLSFPLVKTYLYTPAFSKPGKASGPLVYANYGRKEDFEALEAHNISVKDHIVIVRYGGLFRGLKVELAQQRGAAGVIIYTDLAEDGNVVVSKGYKAYPDGPARQASSVQRGSVQFLSKYPGDPQTPEWPSYKDADRIPINSDTINIPKIPSIPISYEDAIPLLVTLHGRGQLIKDWQGGLLDHGVDYHTGPGQGIVTINNQVENTVKPIWNVYAVIPGQIKDETIFLGNHRDAFIFGAGDPNSGTSSVLEVVRLMGNMLAKGWKPKRTIVVASWDAEEQGLIGSTEFAEDFKDHLKKKTAIYFNTDVASAGSIVDIGASPSLAPLYLDVGSKVAAPDEPEKVLSDYFQRPHAIRPLGSGSDYTPFLQYLGIAAGDLGFRRDSTLGPVYHYHSIYDSEYWMEEFGDPGFKRHKAHAQMLSLLMLRAADNLFLPLNTTYYVEEMQYYLTKVKKLAQDTKPAVGTFDKLDFEALEAALSKILYASKALDVEMETLSKATKTNTNSWWPAKKTHCQHHQHQLLERVKNVNQRLKTFEGGFIDDYGLDGRPWYKHLGIAPGRYLGYGSTPFPGLTEAITLDRDGIQAEIELQRLLDVLERVETSLH